MKHYHGTPLGGTRESVARFVTAGRRHFLVPFNNQEDLPIIAESSCGFCFDCSAYSAWKTGNPITNWQPYYDWCLRWHRNPRFDFSIIPDVIDGTEDDNNQLFADWFKFCRVSSGFGWVEGAPVWHFHESLDRLKYLMEHCRILCLGSSGDWPTPGTDKWHDRMSQAMDIVCDSYGRPQRKLHGLRMLSPEIVSRYPLSSADSTNVARNSQILTRFGMYTPPTQSQRREVIASRIESVLSPSVFVRQSQRQYELFETALDAAAE